MNSKLICCEISGFSNEFLAYSFADLVPWLLL